MAANVEQEALVIDGAADAADIDRILFQDDDVPALLGQLVSGRQSRGPTANNDCFDKLRHFGLRLA